MASERFYKLPEEKREKIINAALHEFCSEPLEAVSINKIVKEAGISRGSFYTYFEDKQDVLTFLGQELQKKHDDMLKESLRKAGGDLFTALEAFAEDAVRYLKQNESFRLQKNVAIHANINPFRALEWDKIDAAETRRTELMEWLLRHVDMSRLNLSAPDELRALLTLCYINIMIMVVGICLEPEREREVRRCHAMRMKFIKEGALKHE